MMRNLRLVARAQDDVDHIFDWLVKRSIRGAIAWYLAFSQVLEEVASNVELFPEAAEAYALSRQLRQALVKTRHGRVYRVVFEALENEVMILRVRGPEQAPLRRRDLPDE